MADFNTTKGITNSYNEDIKDINNTFNPMISNSDQYYNNLVNASDEYANKQTEIQKQMGQQAINEINQNKGYLREDYLKEQKGAYADWQKQSNQYGVNAEKNANLIGSGYSESSQVQMYTAYQNRVATARQSYQRAVTDYDNQITNARLQNSAKLAEIAYQALEKRITLSLEGFQYKNQLLQTRLQLQTDAKNRYASQWSDLRSYLLQEKQLKESKRQFDKEFKLKKKQLSSSSSSSGSSSGGRSYTTSKTGTKSNKNYKFKLKKDNYNNAKKKSLDPGFNLTDKEIKELSKTKNTKKNTKKSGINVGKYLTNNLKNYFKYVDPITSTVYKTNKTIEYGKKLLGGSKKKKK